MNRPRYQTMQFVYDAGSSEQFNVQRAAEVEAENRCKLRPLSTQVVQRNDGDILAIYINGQRFVPDTQDGGFRVR